MLGENVNQTAQFALTGGVEAAFIPYSIVVAPNFKDHGRSVLVPESLHEPIRQRMVLVKGAGETARELYDFVRGPEGRAILERYGFGVPADSGMDWTGARALAQARRRRRRCCCCRSPWGSVTRSPGGGSAGRARSRRSLALPLVLPPTVLGFYLLVTFAPTSAFGALYQQLFGTTLAFSFEGLLVASVIANLPFAVQPVQRGFEAIATEVREAAWLCGMSRLARAVERSSCRSPGRAC